MTDQEKLYETYGELLYVVAMADGVIQDEERETLKSILKKHSWANEIKWSFNYEEAKAHSIDELYNKVISVCHRIGPSPIYDEFIQGMEALALSSSGIDEQESNKINSFSKDLIERFQRDLNRS